jgi:uncharacterized protein YqhQ
MKRTNIGGQAILEGVMMRGRKMYAIAIRKPDKEIIVEKKDVKSQEDRPAICRLPIIRGAIGLVDSLVIGMQTITYSAEFLDIEEEKPSKFDEYLQKKFGDKLNDILIGFSVVLAIALAIGVFMVLPTWISSFLDGFIPGSWALGIVEGLVRLVIFLSYMVIISKMKDIKRVFQYHGAEHKTINCFEHEQELTVENVRKHSRFHKRCGTSFLLIVMVVSMVVFMFVRVETVWIRVLSRVVLFPVVAGISYEFIKLAGRSESKLVKAISAPGMWLQRLTTAEPEDDMIEVAISAMKGVLENEPE